MRLKHVRDRGGEAWTVSLDEDSLTLVQPDNEKALIVSRSEAARYIRFARDLLHGLTIRFIIVEGLKSHAFRCTRAQSNELLRWLPQRPEKDVRKNVRLTALAIGLTGILMLLLTQAFIWFWGAILLLLMLPGMATGRREIYLANAAVLGTLGLIQLVLRPYLGVDPYESREIAQQLATVAGVVLVCWSMHQFGMWSPNQLLRYARSQRDEQEQQKFVVESPLVRTVGRCNLLTVIGLAFYTGGLAFSHFNNEASSPGSFSALPDLMVLGILIVLMSGSAALLLYGKKAAYLEAKISAQTLIVVWVVLFWAVGANFTVSDPMSMFTGVFTDGMFLIDRPYVWAPLIALILSFNVWYSRALDRELEDNRY